MNVLLITDLRKWVICIWKWVYVYGLLLLWINVPSCRFVFKSNNTSICVSPCRRGAGVAQGWPRCTWHSINQIQCLGGPFSVNRQWDVLFRYTLKLLPKTTSDDKTPHCITHNPGKQQQKSKETQLGRLLLLDMNW